MISQTIKNKKVVFLYHNLENMLPLRFDKIICRMVLHHIDNIYKVIENLYNMLDRYGELIIEEGGIIPRKKKKVFNWYNNMMKLKEKRHNFTEEELITYLKETGFRNITTKTGVRKFSINNWLRNSGESISLQKKIYDIHYKAPLFYLYKILAGPNNIDLNIGKTRRILRNFICCVVH